MITSNISMLCRKTKNSKYITLFVNNIGVSSNNPKLKIKLLEFASSTGGLWLLEQHSEGEKRKRGRNIEKSLGQWF